jgi:3-hydroxyisobutyrate dehydrogenase
MPQPRVALIGLGIMGGGMARNLLGAGYPLTVYNRRRERAEPLAAEGAIVADSPREAAQGADIIISIVADDDASRAVWLGDDGALAGAARGAVLIESSTLTIGWVRELARLVADRGCELLDAPVTGSRLQAAAGQLVFLVGGSDAALERALPVLAAMSRDVIHVGPSSSGALIKLINNFMAGLQAASLGEAMALAREGGLDEAKTLEILTNGAPGSPLIRTLVDRIASDDPAPHFALRLMLKDLSYAVAEGERLGVPLRTAQAAREVFGSAVEAGLGDRDMSAVGDQFGGR